MLQQFTAALLICSAASLYSFPLPNMVVETVKQNESEAIAEEAFIYGFPMVMNYQVMYDYSINKDSGQYKSPFNQLTNESHVYTPKDTSVITPNSDTPYSFVGMDLRAEPIILCVPEVEKGRYYSVQLVSMYTFNFGYIGSRTTGQGPGCYAIVGPSWRGDIPNAITKVFRSETDFAFAIFRTQLFNANDIDNVRNIQSGYKVVTLSKYLNKPAPRPAPEINWPPIDKKSAQENPFAYVNFLLQFAPPIYTAAEEVPLRERFKKIGVAAGHPFSEDNYNPEVKLGIQKGQEAIKKEIGNFGKLVNGWRISKTGFGNRAMLKDNWTMRAAAATVGIYGNDAVEALYPITYVDNKGEPLDGSKHGYSITFPNGDLPPVNAFWSVTMYDKKSQLLVANSINRYLINSPMLPDLKKNEDGSITLYIQKDSPGKEKEANWLPAPDAPFYLVLRLYWPKESALNGSWVPPAVKVL